LAQNPSTYRERAIVDVVPARIQRLVISYDNAFVPGRETVEFQRKDGQWKMASPVTAEIRREPFNKLLETVGSLRGDGIVADASAASAYGLEVGGSAVGVLVEYQLVGESGAESAETRPDTLAQFVAFAASQHEGNCYAMRQDGESIYSIKKEAYQQLLAEYRTDRVLDFDEKRVRKFSTRHGDKKLSFEKKGDRWICDAEPDLPLDSKKVENALVQIRDLRTQRYVRNAATDLSPFGLANPGREVGITLDDGSELGLMVAESPAQGGGEMGHFAVTKGTNDVLLLPPDSLGKLDVSVAALE
jgi:hypothetical protein